MRDYGKVGPKFWIGATGKKLRAAGIDAQMVALYLMTSPHANMLGLYYIPKAFIAHETGMPFEGASKGLQSAIDAGFCEYDPVSEMVWVIEMARYQIADALKDKDLRIKGVQNEYDSLPENPFLSRFYDMYRKAFCMSSKRSGSVDLSTKSEAPSKPLASQEQEQEQEQDQKDSCTEPQSASTPEDSDQPELPGLDDLPQFDEIESTEPPPPALKAAAVSELPAIIMPLVGEAEFGILQSHIDEWAGAYPGVDVIRQLAAMRQWCLANPTRRKTSRGVLAFCNNWLAKEQNVGPRAAPTVVKSVSAWWANDQSILSKGAELGLAPRRGESIHTFKGRIQLRLENPDPVAPAAPLSVVPVPEERRSVKPEGLVLAALVKSAPKVVA